MENILLSGSWTMLDVGTGTGILAMYGAMLGASRVMAVDIDPDALRWAHRNIELNDLCGAIQLSSLPLQSIANLSLGTILELIPYFPSVLEPGGWLILSGILVEQLKKVEEALARYGLDENQVHYKEEWACFVCRRGE